MNRKTLTLIFPRRTDQPAPGDETFLRHGVILEALPQFAGAWLIINRRLAQQLQLRVIDAEIEVIADAAAIFPIFVVEQEQIAGGLFLPRFVVTSDPRPLGNRQPAWSP